MRDCQWGRAAAVAGPRRTPPPARGSNPQRRRARRPNQRKTTEDRRHAQAKHGENTKHTHKRSHPVICSSSAWRGGALVLFALRWSSSSRRRCRYTCREANAYGRPRLSLPVPRPRSPVPVCSSPSARASASAQQTEAGRMAMGCEMRRGEWSVHVRTMGGEGGEREEEALEGEDVDCCCGAVVRGGGGGEWR